MPDRMPNRMSEDMSDRMPEDVPVRTCINVMVGITRSKVICFCVLLGGLFTDFLSGSFFGVMTDPFSDPFRNGRIHRMGTYLHQGY